MAINREISQFSNFVSVDDNTKKVSISTSFDIGGDSVISGDVTVGTATTGVVSRNDGTLNVSGISTFLGDINLQVDGNGGIGGSLRIGQQGRLRLRAYGGHSYITNTNFAGFNITSSGPVNIKSSSSEQIATFNPNAGVILYYDNQKKFETTSTGIKVLNNRVDQSNNENTIRDTAVISGPQNIILDPSPDDVVAIVDGVISSAGVSTITGITTTNIAVGNKIQEIDGIISAGTTVTSVGISSLTISNVSLGATDNQNFTFLDLTPTGIVRIKGDLYVDGTTTEINSTTLTIDDLNIVVASGAENGLSADGAGLTVDGADAYLKYNYNAGTNENWEINKSLNIGIAATTVDLPGLYLKGNSDTANFLQNPSISIGGTTNSKYYNTFLVDDPNVQYVRHWANGFDINFSVQDARQFVVSNTDGANSLYAPGVSDDQIAFKIIPESSTELRYNKVKKLETTGYGVSVYGGLNVSGISTFQDRAIFDSTNSIQIPVGTSTERDAVGTAVTGQIRYNTTLSSFEGYGPGGEWGTLGGVKDIDQDTYITAQKDLSVDDDALRFYTNGTEQVSIDSTGKVGIGSTQPTSTLDVDGTLNVSGISTFQDDINVGAGKSILWDTFDNFHITTTGSGAGLVETNGELYFGTTHLYIQKPGGTTTMAEFIQDGAVKLNHNNSTKLQTHDYGIDVTGHTETDTLNVSGIATAQLFSGNGGSLTNVSAFEAYKSDISERAYKTDEISGSLVYAYDGQRFSNLGTGGTDDFAVKSVISKDGKVAFVSEYDTINRTLDSGRIHIYERTGANFTAIGIVTQTSHSSPGAAQTTTCFGPIIACNADGSIFAVGSPQGNSSGILGSYLSWWHDPAGAGQQSVHIFQKNGSTITNIGILTSPSLGSDSNGSDSFGGALAFSDDGSRLYVGSPRRDDNSGGEGAVFVYDKSGSTYNYVGIITTPSNIISLSGGIGQELACSSDGNILFSGWPTAYRPNSGGSGATYSGVIEIYDRSGSNFTNVGIVSSGYYISGNVIGRDFGNEIACSDDGTYLYSISRQPGSGDEQYPYGKLHLFKRVSNTYSEVSSDILDSPVYNGNELGWGLACSSDGSKVIAGECNITGAGAGNTGFVHYYGRVGDNITRVGFATAGIAQGGSFQVATFGFSADLSGSGEVGIVGAPYQTYVNTGGNGAVFFLKETRGTTVYSDILTGNIGIKSDAPKATLDVNGTINVSGISTFHDDVNIGIGGTTAFFDISSGRVGIGSTTPTKLLDVGGTLGVSGISVFTNAVSIKPSNSSVLPLIFDTRLTPNPYTEQIAFRKSNQQAYSIHSYYNNTDGYAYHQLASNSNFEIGLETGSFVVGSAGFPISTKSFEVEETGATTLYYNHNKKLETTGYGVTVTGGLNVSGISTFLDNVRLGIGTNGSNITRTYNTDVNGDSDVLSITSVNDKHQIVQIGFSTTTGTNVFTANLQLEGKLGNTLFDYKPLIEFKKPLVLGGVGLEIGYNSGTISHSWLNTDGSQYYSMDNNGDKFIILRDGAGNYPSSAQNLIFEGGYNDGVKLYHTGNKKLETTGYGVSITGGLNVSGIATAQKFIGEKFIGDGSSLSNVIASSSNSSVNSDYATSVGDVYGYAPTKKYTNDVGAYDRYGEFVSISGDGNILAVSEKFGDSDPRSVTDGGQVIILKRTGGSDAFSTVGVITAGQYYDTDSVSNTNTGGFAQGLDLNYDGSTIIVGAPYHHNPEYTPYGSVMTDMGLAYVYDRNKITNELTLVGILTAGAPDSSLDMETSSYSGVGTDANFGYSVGVNHDGTRYAVGAPKEYHNVYYDGSGGGSSGFAEFEYGAVHVFDRSGSTFTEVKRITNQINGQAHSFDRFGHSIKMSNDGDLIYIGAPGSGGYDSNPQQYGVVCAYDISQTGIANTLGILTGGDNISELQDNFGSSVTCSHDGSIIIVGAPDDEPEGTSTGHGMAYVFEKDNSNNFNRIGIITNFDDVGGSGTDPDTIYESNDFGAAVACNSDASIIAISDSGAEYTQTFLLGAVGIYKRSGSTITRTDIVKVNETGSPATYNSLSTNVLFGNSLSLSDSGRYLAIGAPKDNILTSGGPAAGQGAAQYTSGSATICIQEFKSIITTDNLVNRVGIGSTQPTATLDINGDINVGAAVSLRAAYSGGAYPSDRLYITSTDPSRPGSIAIGTHGDWAGQSFADVDIVMMAHDTTFNFANIEITEVNSNSPLLEISSVQETSGLLREYSEIIQYKGDLTLLAHEDDSSIIFSYGNSGAQVIDDNDKPLVKLNVKPSGSADANIVLGGEITLTPVGGGVTIGGNVDISGITTIGTHSIVSITTSHTASAGTPFTIDTFATSENDLAEYTMHVGYGTYIQAQKVLVMHNGTTAYAQESAVMYQPGKIVSIDATISGGNVLLQATPETGISGITTYKIVRGGLV